MLKHLLFLFFTILLLVIFALGEATHYQVVNGYWTGNVNTKDTILHVSFNIHSEGCEFDCPELNTYNIKTDVIYRNNDAICIDIPSINAQARLAIIQTNGMLQGLFRLNGESYPFVVGLNDIKKRRRP